MSNQPEHAQGSSRDTPLASAAQDVPGLPPILPEDQQLPGASHEQLETSSNAEPGLISILTSILRKCSCGKKDCTCSPEDIQLVSEPVQPTAEATSGEQASSEAQLVKQVSDESTAGSSVLMCCSSDVEDVQSLTKMPSEYDPAKEDARKTHYLSNFITRVQCFLMPSYISIKEKCPFQAKQIEAILGICVRFKQEKCRFGCQKCDDCGVCPHLYSCSCSDTYKHNGLWCAHIHTMHILTKGKFQKKVCLYIQTDVSYMLIRHIRAYLLGEHFMKTTSANTYEEVDNVLSSKSKVERLKEKDCTCSEVDKCINCDGCRCRFTCTCQDYQVDKQVCQHIHGVTLPKDRVAYIILDMPELEFYVVPNLSMKYYVQMEHEMSFYINFENIKKQRGIQFCGVLASNSLELSQCEIKAHNFDSDAVLNTVDSNLQASSDSVLNVPSVFSSEESWDSTKKHDEDCWWIVYQKSKLGNVVECSVRSHFYLKTCSSICKVKGYSTENNCARCGICFRHYTCDCPLDSTIICRHVHAIHRMINDSTETPQEAEQFVRETLQLPALQAGLPDSEWATHAGRVGAPQAGHGMGVLPTLTD